MQAWSPAGLRVTDEVGELVVAQPMPSMPVGFWGDESGDRLRQAYFDHFPGTWRHGDWVTITSRGTAVIHGRSDATINRGGVRMGTADICRVVVASENVTDALVLDVPQAERESWMPLFVVLAPGAELDTALRGELLRRIREDCSPRHVPSAIIPVEELPVTHNGKALEVPLKRLLAGEPASLVVDVGSLRNPAALEPFLALAADRRAGR